MNSIHAAKVRIIKATVSMFVGLNTVASSGNWAFRAAPLLCSHDTVYGFLCSKTVKLVKGRTIPAPEWYSQSPETAHPM